MVTIIQFNKSYVWADYYAEFIRSIKILFVFHWRPQSYMDARMQGRKMPSCDISLRNDASPEALDP